MATAQSLMGRGYGGVGGTQPVITTATEAGPNFAGMSITPYAEGGPVGEGVGGLFAQMFAEGGVVGNDVLTSMRQNIIELHGFDPVEIAMEQGVDPDLLLRMMYQESSWGPECCQRSRRARLNAAHARHCKIPWGKPK
jgi:hypothetical protein